MKLKKEYISHKIGKKYFIISTDTSLFSGMARCNDTTATIVDCLKKETDVDQIVERMLSIYDVERDVITRDVENIIGQLRTIDAIDE